MSVTSHPRDSQGLPLPDGSWPDEPGVAMALEIVRRFCNSVNREHGADAWRSVSELSQWIADEGFSIPHITADDLRRAILAREAIHRSLAGGRAVALDALVSGVRMQAAVDNNKLTLVAANGGIDDVFVALIAAILRAQHDGTWSRLKACRHCQWVFYDKSKNRSGVWCSMDACGARRKARAYRSRRR